MICYEYSNLVFGRFCCPSVWPAYCSILDTFHGPQPMASKRQSLQEPEPDCGCDCQDCRPDAWRTGQIYCGCDQCGPINPVDGSRRCTNLLDPVLRVVTLVKCPSLEGLPEWCLPAFCGTCSDHWYENMRRKGLKITHRPNATEPGPTDNQGEILETGGRKRSRR